MTGMGYLNEMQPPRFFKTHFQCQQQLNNPKAKFIYLTRNPLDVCVSFYHYVRKASVYHFADGTFDDFVHAFVAAEVERGDYCDHLLSWYAHRHEENIFFLTFEQLKNDFRNTVLSLAGFMGEKYRRVLVEDEDVYRNVVQKSSVPYMSKMCYVDQSVIDKLTEKDQPYIEAVHRYMLATPGKIKGSNIVRKGAVGDWKSHFTQEHLELMREWIAKRNAGAVIRDLWADMDLGGIV
ncbi:sulfotransferase ssu-1-like [Rhipicephalus sanguineus]|uniref:sulfotransferase ssu-1-like n=1 Tax=Rhipicephalus sanguineus TaxID=34632 RepID=UPI0020C3B931|nr:sulfotransferase ssu-1-like [Rhipicephalus sanguineus]